jgi:UDP-N-acetyl-2-amino-2-deoxyglucuronate dehydrogenase
MSEPNAAPVDPSPALNWSVWRTDDNGNTFLVRGGLTQKEALQLVAEFSARGHKQLYFVEQQK